MIREFDLTTPDGRVLHAYDTGPRDDDHLVVVWHHGTPNIGAPPQPLFGAEWGLRVRWVSYDRPGYGGSTTKAGRDIASAATDVGHVADELGIERFAVMGHSGGSPHALACAALLPHRVLAAATIASLAPRSAEGLDWFAGMAGSSRASLGAAAEGRSAKERYEATAEFDPTVFTPADHAALGGSWSWLLDVVRPALAAGPAALIDDDLAYVAPWGFDLSTITAPTLLMHGAADRMVPPSHSEWLADHCASATLQLHPGDGHISILNSAPSALAWLCERAVHSSP
ncbi:MAG: alpha/beta hydrolase [bacterium]